MKKKLIMKLATLLIIVCASLLCACTSDSVTSDNKNDNTSNTPINVACMKGPTGIGMVKLFDDCDNKKSKCSLNYTITGTADEISTSLINGSLDIAAVPCNLASILYNKTEGDIVTVAINTLGVLYIVETGNEINSVSDLKGKTIYSTGQGTTPEYTLRFLLSQNGLDPDKDIDIQYKSEASEVVADLSADGDGIAMLPQPYVSVAGNTLPTLRIALDVTAEWEKLDENSSVITGVLVARRSFIEENPDAFKIFLNEYEKSCNYANSNVEETATLVEKYDIFKAAIAKKAIPYCNICFINGSEMVTKATSYLNVLYDENPASVGGAVKEGMFYVEK